MGHGDDNFPRDMALLGHAERVIAAYSLTWVESCQGLSRVRASPRVERGKESQYPYTHFVYPFICPGFLVFLQDGSTVGIGNYFSNLSIMLSHVMRVQTTPNSCQFPTSPCMDQQKDTFLSSRKTRHFTSVNSALEQRHDIMFALLLKERR